MQTYQQAYYEKNRERILMRVKKLSSSDEFKKSKRIYDKEYRKKNLGKITLRVNKWYKEHAGYRTDCAKRWKQKNPLPAQFNRYKERAKRKGIEFEFSRSEFFDLILLPCAYCGFARPMGADRIDSSMGYVKDNVVPCCKMCNYMKLNHSLEDFLIHMREVLDYLKL